VSSDCEGLLLLDKPGGITSHDVVNAVRRRTGQRRVGHAGTLDPLATGLLPVLLGRATRLVRDENRSAAELLEKESFLKEQVIKRLRGGDVLQVDINLTRLRERLSIENDVEI